RGQTARGAHRAEQRTLTHGRRRLLQTLGSADRREAPRGAHRVPVRGGRTTGAHLRLLVGRRRTRLLPRLFRQPLHPRRERRARFRESVHHQQAVHHRDPDTAKGCAGECRHAATIHSDDGGPVNASRGAASRRLMRVMGGAAAAGGLIACATSHPEQRMTVTSAEGHTVRFDSVTVSYMAGGVQVIQRPNYANDVVAVHLYLLGGTRQLTPATQGIEALLLRASEYGTTNYPGGATREAWGRTGSEIIIDPSEDWTVYGFMGLRQDFDSSWNVWADRLMHPTLSTSAVSLVRGRMISALRRSRDDPDAYVSMLADSVTFAGSPYGLQPAGTEQTLAALDSAALSAYARAQMVTSRMLLVVVGSVDRAAVTAAVTRTLATLPHGTYVWSLPAAPRRMQTSVTFVQRPLQTNYILGLFEGPPASEADLQAFRVATAFLSSRISGAVCEERGLSYAAGAPFTELGVSTGGIYVTT